MTVTVDRRPVALHEAGHVAGLIMACRRLPTSVRADWPAERILGQMELDWSTEGLTPKMARGLMIAVLLGPIAERREAWPLDPDGDGDARQLALLADYLKSKRPTGACSSPRLK